MAKHTITISDEEGGGICIRLGSEGSLESMAGITAAGLMLLAKKIVPVAAKTAAERNVCPCVKCQAARASLEIPPGTTIH
ncbi:hypothetical protein [Pseudomonas sp. MBLB4136]|uniref:hypothetical protein n=1 Tax=Pseudomonas sp. MBLB4136 TaxID=3451558 RepID=UPI003F75682E